MSKVTKGLSTPKKPQRSKQFVVPQPGHRQVITPNVAQPKTVLNKINFNTPAAPPAYRPQPVPRVLQRKTTPINQAQKSLSGRQPVAPPVYRPQPVPKVLQTKVAVTNQPVNRSRIAPVAPAVYRPQPTPKVLQRYKAPARQSGRRDFGAKTPMGPQVLNPGVPQGVLRPGDYGRPSQASPQQAIQVGVLRLDAGTQARPSVPVQPNVRSGLNSRTLPGSPAVVQRIRQTLITEHFPTIRMVGDSFEMYLNVNGNNVQVSNLELGDYDDDGRIWLMYVDTPQQYQRRGYATMLMRAAVRHHGAIFVSQATQMEHENQDDNDTRWLTNDGAAFVNACVVKQILRPEWLVNPFWEENEDENFDDYY